jgi:Immunoglobulin domain/Regulator of chromosome condensation (RCC1) repeat/Immunoglobulin I-set domain/NHL repeat
LLNHDDVTFPKCLRLAGEIIYIAIKSGFIMIVFNHKGRRTSTRLWPFAENRYMKIASPFQKANWLSVCLLTLVILFSYEHLAPAAVINQQPQSTNVLAGSNATFTVVAGGTAPLRYRWQFNWTNLANGGRISGATNSTLLITAVVSIDAGGYRVVVSNSASVVTSSVATLTVLVPPGITTQPTNQSVLINSNVTFSAAASGTGPLFYQWQKDGTNLVNGGSISGATNSVLTISAVQTNDAGGYRLVVSNAYGMITSLVAVLTVLIPPGIATQPQSQMIFVGSNVTFTVAATGDTPLAYQWQFNGVAISNAGSSSLTLTNVPFAAAGNYSVVVTNIAGSVTSASATLTVVSAPAVLFNVDFGDGPFGAKTGPAAVGLGANDFWNVLLAAGTLTSVNTASGNPTPVGLTVPYGMNNWLIDRAMSGDPMLDDYLEWTGGIGGISVSSLPPGTYDFYLYSHDSNLEVTSGGVDYGWKNAFSSFPLTTNWLPGQQFVVFPNVIVTNSSQPVFINVQRYVQQEGLISGIQIASAVPWILQQPSNTAVAVGSNLVLQVSGESAAPLAYQWFFNGNLLANGGRIAGATGNTLTVSGAQFADAGGYFVVLTHSGGATTSSVVTVQVGFAPMFVQLPTNQTVVLGSPATFGVMASGTGPLTYQWLLDGTNLPANLITTVAGNGAAGYAGDGSAAGKAMLNSPHGVALDANHNVFIADTSNHRIRKMDTNGIITTVAGNGTNGFSGDGGLATNASLNSPGHIAYDSAGNLFIADTANHRIRKVDVNGLITTVAGIGTNGYSGDGDPATNASLNTPGGIAFDSAGNLYIADAMNSRVRKVDTNHVITTVAGNGSSAWPTTGDGGPATNAIVRNPLSVAVDASGNLYIADAGDDRVRKVDINGIITTFAGGGPTYYSGDGGPATNASLWTPVDLCFDASGNLFIADVYNNRIRKVDTNGIITTVAGLQGWVYNGDNMAATSATLYFPFGVAVDAAGNLFIADTDNHRIREVEVTTYPTLTLNGVTANLAGDYQVIISNIYGSITSSIATLTVLLPPAIATQPGNHYVLLNGSAAFTVTATGDAPLSYQWLYNGVALSDNSSVSGSATKMLAIQNVQTPNAGAYQVVVTNAWGAATSSIANLFIATARYVNASNPSSSPPYTSWATAATVIQNAIDAANVGDWILVSNGVYATGGRVVSGKKWNRVVMTNQVTVIAVNGPLVTKILGDVSPDIHTYGTRCVWLGSGATLSGFTIASGGNYYGLYNASADDDRGGGILGESQSAVVTDCIITGNTGCWWGGGVDNATLINCLLTGNNAWQGQPGVGGGAYNCTLVNCTVVGNLGGLGGGGVAYGTCENCIVYDNPDSGNGGNYFYTSFTNSCTTPDPGGVGNTTNDPAFVDYAGGDYRLQFNSPCINAGANTFVAGAVDLDGAPRVVDGVVDMGAYEYQHSPFILVSPVSQSILVYSNVTFTVLALGDEPLTYQWQKDGVDLADDARVSGTSTPSLVISNLLVADASGYRVIVTNASGSVTSAVATLTLLGPPSISVQPVGRTVPAGTNVSFSVTASGLAALFYQWRSNQTEVAGRTNSSLSLTNVQSANSGDYDVVITNIYGAITSSVATLAVLPAAPLITTQAMSRVASVGQSFSFTVAARGSEPMTCQWQFNGAALPGANAFTLALTNVNASFTGIYRAAVSNAVGSAFTTNITLTVSPVIMWGLTNLGQVMPSGISIPAAATNVIAIAAGGDGNLGLPCMALRGDGTLVRWGVSSRDIAVPGNAVDVVAMSIGGESKSGNYLALRTNGTLVHWTAFSIPSVPAALTNGNIVAVAAGAAHQLALRDDGTVFAWGSNPSGQTNVPTSATNVIAIAAGLFHSLALRADGTVVGWGLNTSGQATALSNIANVVAIAAGGNQSLGLLADGTVVGRIVTNTPGAAVNYGPPAGNISNKIAITAGVYHSLAIGADRTINGWGATNYGQITIPPYATNVLAIAAGGNDSLALVPDPFAPPIPPRIGRPPLGRALKAGDNVVFNALAVGGLPLHYQWLRDGSPLAGKTNQWLALTNAHPGEAGDYQLVAMNTFGSTTSAVATITVSIPAPVLTSTGMVTNGFRFSFTSIAEVIYIVEYRDSLSTGVWTELERRFGMGGLEIVTDTLANGAMRFYRVRALYAPPPKLAAATWSGGSVNSSFATVAGAQYVVEYTDQLAPPQWHELQTIVGTGSSVGFADPTPAGPQRFYRLRVR